MYDDDIEGSIEADNTDFSRGKSKEKINVLAILILVISDSKSCYQI